MTNAHNAVLNVTPLPVDLGEWPIKLSNFEHEWSQPRAIETNWGGVVQELTNPPEYPAKKDCPLLNLAVFGSKRKQKPDGSMGSLRTNENVLCHHGVVVDYDGRVVPGVSFEVAVARLKSAKIEAVVYTSPSHMQAKTGEDGTFIPAGPRWRVVAPFSEPHGPEQYAHYVDLLNGALRGVLDRESWDISRCYYYGRVTGVEYRCERTATGVCLDNPYVALLSGPVGRPSEAERPSNQAARQTDEARQQRIDSVTDETMDDLRSALEYLAEHTDMADDRDSWIDIGQALASLKGTDFEEAAFELWDEFSQESYKYNHADLVDRWGGFDPNKITFASIFRWAQNAGWKNPRTVEHTKATDIFKPVRGVEHVKQPNSSSSALDHVAERSERPTSQQVERDAFDFDPDRYRLCTVERKPSPARDFAIPGILLAGVTHTLSAYGGRAKTATLIKWAREIVLKHGGAAYLILGEENEDEARRRLAAVADINKDSDQQRAVIDKFLVPVWGAGCDLRLLKKVGNSVEPTNATERIIEAIQKLRLRGRPVRLVTLDHVMLFNAEDPNNAGEATRLNEEANRIAVATGAAVVTTMHWRKPSQAKNGADDNSEFDVMGSAFNINNPRGNLLLHGMREKEAKQYGIPAVERENYIRLARGKTNFAKRGDVGWMQIVYSTDHQTIAVVDAELKEAPKADRSAEEVALFNTIVSEVTRAPGKYTVNTFGADFARVWKLGGKDVGRDKLRAVTRQLVSEGKLAEREQPNSHGGPAKLALYVSTDQTALTRPGLSTGTGGKPIAEAFAETTTGAAR